VKAFRGGGTAAAFSPNTTFPAVAYATITGLAYLYEFDSGQTIPLTGATDVIESINFDLGGGYLVTADRDDVVRVYNTDGGQPVEMLTGHKDRVINAGFGVDDYYIASSSDDGTARLWQGPNPVPSLQLADAPLGDGAAAGIGFADGGRLIVEVGGGRTYSGQGRILDASTLHTLSSLHAPAGQVFLGGTGGRDGPVLTLSEPLVGSRLNAAAAQVESYDLQSGARLATILPGDGHAILDAIPNRGGSEVVTLESGGRAEIWDTRSGRLLRILQGPTTPADAAAFSDDGTMLAVAHYPALPAKPSLNPQLGSIVIQLWDPRTGRLLDTINGERLTPEIYGTATYAPLAVAFSPNGRLLGVSGADSHVDVFDLKIRVVHRLSIQGLLGGSLASSLAFSPDGTLLAAGSSAGAYVWQLSRFTLEPVFQQVPAGSSSPFEGGLSEVRVGFSDDSRYLETLGDKTLEVWSVPDHLQLFRDFPVIAGSMDFAATKLVTATASGVSVYPCQLCGDMSQLLSLARRRVTRGFTPAERAQYLSQG
jgi:WD40 repeat protein